MVGEWGLEIWFEGEKGEFSKNMIASPNLSTQLFYCFCFIISF
jgi:hypothetical protein